MGRTVAVDCVPLMSQQPSGFDQVCTVSREETYRGSVTDGTGRGGSRWELVDGNLVCIDPLVEVRLHNGLPELWSDL